MYYYGWVSVCRSVRKILLEKYIIAHSVKKDLHWIKPGNIF